MQVAEDERLNVPLRDLPHLVRRFIGHLGAVPLTPTEQAEVRSALDDDRLASLFFRQTPPDQRHALNVAQRFQDSMPDHGSGFRAALLHDVGKAATPAGAIGRSLATVVDELSMPLPGSWRTYRDHGPLGARALEEAGADELAVAFARHHPGEAPPSVDAAVWQALLDADDL